MTLAGNRYFRRRKKKIMKLHILFSLFVVASLSACSPEDRGKSRGPIVLGDSSTIVTETDTAILQDVVADIQVPAEQLPEAPAEPARDTVESTPAAAAPTPAAQTFSGDGLQIGFQEVNVFFPGIDAKTYSKGDLKKARSATFELQKGRLAGGKMQLAPAGGKITKVTQRYESTVGIQQGSGSLTLSGLGKYRSDWKELNPGTGAYILTGLDQPEFHSVSAPTFRNAVTQQTRRDRMSKQESKQLSDLARNYRSVKQAPARIEISSVSWRIEGQDAAGKKYNKEVRMDLPR